MKIIKKIRRKLPHTIGEWFAAIVLAGVASIAVTVFILFMRLAWGHILS